MKRLGRKTRDPGRLPPAAPGAVPYQALRAPPKQLLITQEEMPFISEMSSHRSPKRSPYDSRERRHHHLSGKQNGNEVAGAISEIKVQGSEA